MSFFPCDDTGGSLEEDFLYSGDQTVHFLEHFSDHLAHTVEAMGETSYMNHVWEEGLWILPSTNHVMRTIRLKDLELVGVKVWADKTKCIHNDPSNSGGICLL